MRVKRGRWQTESEPPAHTLGARSAECPVGALAKDLGRYASKRRVVQYLQYIFPNYSSAEFKVIYERNTLQNVVVYLQGQNILPTSNKDFVEN